MDELNIRHLVYYTLPSGHAGFSEFQTVEEAEAFKNMHTRDGKLLFNGVEDEDDAKRLRRIYKSTVNMIRSQGKSFDAYKLADTLTLIRRAYNIGNINRDEFYNYMIGITAALDSVW